MTTTTRARLLAVDDEAANLAVLEALLGEFDADLVKAASGEEALGKALTGDFAAILMDVRMPGMDGLETARILRSQRRFFDTPILFISAAGDEHNDSLAAYELGAVDYLLKPVAPTILKAKIGFFLELYWRKQELRAAQAQAVSDRAFMAAVLDAIEDAIVACDSSGNLTLFNRATQNLHGPAAGPVDPAEWATQFKLYRADGKTLLAEEEIPLRRALAGEAVKDSEMVVVPQDGSPPRLLSATAKPLLDAQGKRQGAVVSMHDITAQRESQVARERTLEERARREQAEAAAATLFERNALLTIASESSGLALFTWNVREDTVVWHNDQAYRILGHPASEPAVNSEQFANDYLLPDDRPAFEKAVKAVLAKGQPLAFTGRIRRASDGVTRWLEMSGMPRGGEGKSLSIVGTVADVTERIRGEEALKESETRLRQLANSIPNLAWMADADGYITWYNDRWYTYTGTTPADMEGWGWQKVHDPAVLPEVMARWTESIATGNPFEMTFPLRAGDGSYRPFFTLVAPLKERDGKVLQWFGTNTDVSTLKEAENELLEASKRKDEFMAMLAHELRNPLAPVRSASTLLEKLPVSDVRVARAAQVISRQVGHMASLLNDLLDVSRVTFGRIEFDKKPVEFASAIAHAIEQVQPLMDAKHHRFSFENHAPGVFVSGSEDRLTQVVANLLENAAKYCPAQSTISLHVEASLSTVDLVVADNGPGLEEGLARTIFEPFSQGRRSADRSEGGLGLGLALVNGLVKLHGGTVSVSSGGPGKGCRFAVTLPVLAPESMTDTTAAASPLQALRKNRLNVLVVDDNTDAADTLAHLLEMSGHKAHVAHTAMSALESLRHQDFDVAILDIGLPDITGLELARRIRITLPRPPELVAVTGYGQHSDREAAMAAGFGAHHVKPVDPDALLQTISDLTSNAA